MMKKLLLFLIIFNSVFAEPFQRRAPDIAYGSTGLFSQGAISSSFQKLLECLVGLGCLNPDVLSVKNLEELNSFLQKEQGEKGGFLRKIGSERWELSDASISSKKKEIVHLFKDLGFISSGQKITKIEAEHIILFGATAKSMELRVKEALKVLPQSGTVYLLAGNRKLLDSEKAILPPGCETESDAFVAIWKKFSERSFVLIDATEKGEHVNRPTTEITIKNWMERYLKKGERTSVFALVEEPFFRMTDLLRFMLLSDNRKATKEEFEERQKNIIFQFVHPKASCIDGAFISVILDEIARNVYLAKEFVSYYEGLN